MPTTSLAQPPARRSPAHRHYGPPELRPARPRQAHFGPGGLARRRAQLEACWRERLERVTALAVAFHDEAGSDGQRQHGSTESRRARTLARQAVAERQALADIEAALDRISAGQYGWCEQCGRPIAGALLAVHPQVRYCAACGRRAAPLRSAFV